MKTLMLLPSKTVENSVLVALPDDVEPHAAYRCAVSIIATAEAAQNTATKQEITQALEDHGFTIMEYVVGPELTE